MKLEPRSNRWRFGFPALWLLLAFSLSAWWMVHGLRQAGKLSVLPSAEELARQHRMFFWEGSFLLSMILSGGLALFYLIYLDNRKNEEMRHFFSSFTHDLKTSLTSLRLQAEILEEDPRNSQNANLRRLLADVVRLELQLENALILAKTESTLFLEALPLSRVVQNLSVHWPSLKISVEHDSEVQADQRALECILKNLFQNAAVHGNAKHIFVTARTLDNKILVTIQDDGKGFPHPETLGTAFTRHTTKSGSGLGLYLSRLLAKRMAGDLYFRRAEPHGFQAELRLGGKA